MGQRLGLSGQRNQWKKLECPRKSLKRYFENQYGINM
jgi:hypothetical protein